MIRNTANDTELNSLLMLADGMDGGDGTRVITAMEAAGQRQLVHSDRLPTNTSGKDDEYLALGFTFGEPDPADPLFRPAMLPEGWKREASDHSMWSHLVDELGRKRVAIFYKAAFYDRDAFMRLETGYSYLSSCLYDKRVPVLDDEWLPAAGAIEELAHMHVRKRTELHEAENRAKDAGPSADYWTGRAGELRNEADQIEALANRIAATNA